MEEAKTEQAEGILQKPKKVWIKRVIYIVVACLVTALVFFAGFFTRYWTLDKELQMINDVKNGIQKSYYKDVTDEEFYDAIFDAINNVVLDRYSKYMDKDEWAEYTAHGKGKYEGIGLAFTTSTEGTESLKITRVASNSPAERAGIQAGDYVVAICGAGEAEQTLTSYTQFKVLLENYDLNEEFRLYTCATPTGADRTEYVVAQKKYVENYVFYRSQTGAYRFTGTEDAVASAYENALDVLPLDTAYIKLTQFNGNADKAFDRAMSIFKSEGKKNLVLDLRGNGGGYMYIMQNIAKYFCKNSQEKNPVASYAQYENSRTKYVASGNVYDEYFATDSQVYVLADSASASASECLLGVLIDYGTVDYARICLSERAGVAKTYGKGIMQVTFPLSIARGDALKLTTARVLWPSEKCIHDRGILSSDGTKTVKENPNGDTEIVEALQQFGLI